MLLCKFCKKECKNTNSLKNHESRCPLNLNRNYKNGMTGKKGSNQYVNGAIMSSAVKDKISESNKGKKHTEETKRKLSKIRSDWMKENPDKTRRKKSYMEIAFSDWLREYGISFKEEVHFRNTQLNKNYFVDFLFEDKKLIIELDGNQHENRKELDQIRDSFLKSLGYTIIRITHKEFISKSRIEEITELLGCVER